MSTRARIAIGIFIVVLAWKILSTPGEVTLGPGVRAPEVPRQSQLDSPVSHDFDRYTVTDLAEFSLTAKVLARKDYSLGLEADISPIDLALGWGNMSDEAVLEEIEITQSNRFYWWRVDDPEPPIPVREIERSSANMHLIPASEGIESELRRVRKGDIVELEGYLVKVDAKDENWIWRSSMTRNDTGAGACELFRVQKVAVLN